jgi:hypothetical protein
MENSVHSGEELIFSYERLDSLYNPMSCLKISGEYGENVEIDGERYRLPVEDIDQIRSLIAASGLAEKEDFDSGTEAAFDAANSRITIADGASRRVLDVAGLYGLTQQRDPNADAQALLTLLSGIWEVLDANGIEYQY